eukprot:g53198.t1
MAKNKFTKLCTVPLIISDTHAILVTTTQMLATYMSVRQRKPNPSRDAPDKAATPPPATRGKGEGEWTLSWGLLAVHLAVRLLAALYQPIPDCDETFNYLEPIHMLMYQRGLQTWEYSPAFSLRSYIFILFYVLPLQLLQQAGLEAQFGKIALFYALRILVGLVSLCCEVRFARAVGRRCGPELGYALWIVLMFSAGLFHCTVAILPQTFAMWCVLCCMTAWLQARWEQGVFWMGAASLLGWPFAVLLGIPFGVDLLAHICRGQASLLRALMSGVLTIISLVGASVAVDYYYYRRIMVAVFNIALYNAPKEGSGGELYGTEPWTYYLLNLFLQFNVGCVLAALSPLGLLAFPPQARAHLAKLLSCAALWLGIFWPMPHKEERFLFVIYPLLALAAATTTTALTQLARRITPTLGATFKLLLLGLLALLSTSRAVGLIKHYGAPLDLYAQLARDVEAWAAKEPDFYLAHEQTTNVCVGKEWYRFPSHFFLPDVGGRPTKLQFLKSQFDGLLPKHYASSGLPAATSAIPTGMNGLNREEFDRYVHVTSCHYIVDLDLPDQEEEHFDQISRKFGPKVADGRAVAEWEVVGKWDFLDAGASPSAFRAFFVPGLDSERSVYRPYQLLRRRILQTHV